MAASNGMDAPAVAPPVTVTDENRQHQFVGRVLLVLILLAMVILERIDVALGGAHLTAEDAVHPAGGFGDIASPARLLDAAATGDAADRPAVQIAQGWQSLAEVAGPLINAYGVVDLILMVTLSVWLAGLFLRRDQGATWPAVAARLIGVGAPGPWWRPSFILVVQCYLLADAVETVTLWVTWGTLGPGVATVIAGASLLKWVCLAFVLLLLVVRYRYPASPPIEHPVMRRRDGVLALRGQFGVVIVLVGLLLALQGDIGRQIDEVLVVAAGQLVSIVVATFAAGVTTVLLALGGVACLQAYLAPPGFSGLGSRLQERLMAPQPTPGPDQTEAAQRKQLADHAQGARRFHGWLALAFLIVAVGLLILGSTLPTDWQSAPRSLAVPFGIGWVLLVPAWFQETRRQKVQEWYLAPVPADPAESTPAGVLTGREWLVVALADVPLVVLVLAIARAATTVGAAGHVPWGLVLWGIGGLVLWLVIHWRLLSWVEAGPWLADDLVPRVRLWALVAGFGLLVCGAVLPHLVGNWLGFYQALGTPAILMIFAAIMSMVLTGLTLLSDSLRPGGMLEAFGIHRVPIFTVLVVWGLLATTIDPVGAYYVVRTEGGRPAREPLATNAFDAWKAREVMPRASGQAVPLVFVAAAGGGIRAAYWTRLGMDCVFGPACPGEAPDVADHTGSVFLASGVSGGSLGLMSTRTRQLGESTEHDVDKVLGADFIAPSLASFLFADQLNGFLRLPIPGVNRADTLELAWEASDEQLKEPFGADTTFPRLVLNSTSIEDGCRLEVSEVEFPTGGRACAGDVGNLPNSGPGHIPTRDAFAHLCQQATDDEWLPTGLRRSTAVLMAARFPYVSPGGGLRGCALHRRTFAIDGGLVDNSGATAVLEAWSSLAESVAKHNAGGGACIVPKLVVFDSAQAASVRPEADDRPPQASAPLLAALGGFDRRSATPVARAAHVIDEAAKASERACGLRVADDQRTPAQSAVVVIAPHEQPGPGLPLGWTLSEQTRTQMRHQLVGNGSIDYRSCATSTDYRNCGDWADIAKVHAWFGR